MIFILNYLDYNKEKATEEMRKLYGWERSGLSMENLSGLDSINVIFSLENLVLIRGVLICRICTLSGVITRDEALRELSTPPYKDNLESDKEMIFEKYRINETEFEEWMNQPNRSHSDFKTERWIKVVYASAKTFIPWFKTSTRH